MTRALLHLNDLNLCWQTEGELPTRAIGVAHCSSKGVICGHEAFDKLWIEPQYCYTQYWQQFNENSLLPPTAGVRHNADLVFHQLRQLQQSQSGSEQIDQLLVAPPSHFCNADFQLLLAVGQSLKLPICSFIDPSIASIASSEVFLSPQANKALYVDMQLHQTLIVEVLRQDDIWAKGKTTTLSDSGLMPILNSAAHYLADLCISEHRFDPLKIAASSQKLYRLIYSQLLYLDTDFPVEFETGNSRLTCTVSAKAWQEMLGRKLAALHSAIGNNADQNTIVCLHDNSQWLTHTLELTHPIHVVNDENISAYLFKHWSNIVGDELVHIDALAQSREDSQYSQQGEGDAVGGSTTPLASHLLVDNTAYSLENGLWITDDNLFLQVHSHPVENALVELSLNENVLKTRWRTEGKAISAKIGETFMLHNRRLTFISVSPPAAPVQAHVQSQAQSLSSDQ